MAKDKRTPIDKMSKDRAYFYVYEMAKKFGDKFPEVVAAQFALESASGTSAVFKRTNNPFGQTTLEKNDAPAFKDANGRQYYWKKYESLEDAIKDRSTGKWAKKYQSAKDPISAMAMIQPEYAPSSHDNGHYMKSIANILKNQGFYNGNTDIPNPDDNPEFYNNSKWNEKSKSFNLTGDFKQKVFDDYLAKIEEINQEPNEKLRAIKLDELNREQWQKGYIKTDALGNPGGFLNRMLEDRDKKLNEERQKKIKLEKREKRVKFGEREQGVKIQDNTRVRQPELPRNRSTQFKNPQIRSVIDINPEWDVQDSIDSAVDGTLDLEIRNDGEDIGTKPVEGSGVADFERRAADSFGDFIDKEELIVPDTFQYDPNDFDRQLPIGAVAQGALGLIGLGDAETELPLRDEQVSEAILNYAKTNKKLAEIGLRPEEEAAMKADVAEAYQEGMTQLVRASGGNRNLVLGNASSLNLNRIKGITNISLADIQRKDAAYERYGKTLEYIENFNTNRDVANHGIKLQEAQQKRQAGAQLAASGFAGMIEELQFQRENGPGSANHMLRQHLMYSSFGVVPGMKDDGTGTKVGTASYAKAQAEAIKANNASIREDNELNRAFRSRINTLSDGEKERLNQTDFFEKVQDPEIRKHWVETGIVGLPEEQQMPSPAPNSDLGMAAFLQQLAEDKELNPPEEFSTNRPLGFFSF